MTVLFVLVVAAALAADPQISPGLVVQPRAVSSFSGEPTLDLAVQRVRPALRGSTENNRSSFFVQAELAGTARLLDAVVVVKPMDGFELHAGRFLVPISRAQLTPVPKLQFQGFSEGTNAVRHGRDAGAMVHAFGADERIDFRGGLFQSATSELNGTRPLAVARLASDLVGRVPLDATRQTTSADPTDPALALGIAGALGSDTRARDLAVLRTVVLAGELAGSVGRSRIQAEAFARSWSDGAREEGAYVQASIGIAPSVEWAGRADLLVADVQTWTGQSELLWYQDGNHLRTSLEYTWRRVEGGAPTQQLALQEQLWF